MVLSVCENEHGQTATVSGNDTSIFKHACVGTDADTDYMEVIEDPDLCQNLQLCKDILCLGKLTKDDDADLAAFANLID